MNKKIIKSAMSISIIGIVVKVFGFVKQAVIAYYFGANFQTDAYFLSSGFIGNMAYLLCTPLAITFLTMYIKSQTNETEDKTNTFVSSTVELFMLIGLCFGLILYFFAPQVSKVLAPLYTSDQVDTVAIYLRYMIIILALQALVTIHGTILDANKIFIPKQFNGLIQSLTIIIALFCFSQHLSIQVLITAFIISFIFQYLFLKIFTRKRFHFRFVNPFIDKREKQLITLILPLLVGYGAIEINQIVDKMITSGLGEGVVSALSYAQTISTSITQLFIAALVTVLFTYLTESVEKKKFNETLKLTKQSVLLIILITLPVSVWCCCYSSEIITVLYARGSFSQEAVKNTSLALVGYGIGFVIQGIREVLVKAHYAFHDTKRPTINSIVSIVFNIIFSIFLSRYIGVLGVTLATSIAGIVSVIMFTFTIKNHFLSVEKNKNSEFVKKLVKIFGSGIIMSCSIFITKSFLDSNVFIELIVGCLFSGLVFVIFLKVLKVSEIDTLWSMVKKKTRKQ